MIPSPPSGKPVAFYDTECFLNYWLLKIRPRGGAVFTYCLRSGEVFDGGVIGEIDRLFQLFTVVSFNGIYYDVPMIAAALSGYTPEQLQFVNNQIIISQMKPWELSLPEWKPADHIDCIEVAPGAGSQKTYAGRIHCKTMRDLPYSPDKWLNEEEIAQVDSYCENDLFVLESLFDALQPQIHIRESMSKRYGIDLRSKSDAQLGEAIIKIRCEKALGQRIYKPDVDWNLKFRYEPPSFLSFQYPQARAAFELIKNAIFTLGGAGAVSMPAGLDGLEVAIEKSVYRLGIGGIHSSEKRIVHKSDDQFLLRDADVASYYPRLILGSGKWPPALGSVFRDVYQALTEERLKAKTLQKKLEEAGVKVKDPHSGEGYEAYSENEGLKIAINGSFGKLGNFYSVLFAPEMLIQTTVTGQLALLMLIEWYEIQGIPVISANTDGLVIKCPHSKLEISESIIKYWEKTTGLEMECSDLAALYSRDVNNYFLIKADGKVKRKGEYSKAGLVEKKNPDVEICGDAVEEFLSKGTPLAYTIAACRDITKFVTIQKVAGGAVKLWGEGPRKEALVRDMIPILQANGWVKSGRKWIKGALGLPHDPTSAYRQCFAPQRPEYLGKVIRWYYSTQAPGSIIYNTNGNTVSLSYGGRPCMVLPEEFPSDIDYDWYLKNCEKMLRDVGYYDNGALTEFGGQLRK